MLVQQTILEDWLSQLFTVAGCPEEEARLIAIHLVDADASTYGPDDLSRHLLYVGITRAAHQLWLLHCGNPSSLLPDTLR